MKIAVNKQHLFKQVLFAWFRVTHKIKGILREPLGWVGKGRE